MCFISPDDPSGKESKTVSVSGLEQELHAPNPVVYQ